MAENDEKRQNRNVFFTVFICNLKTQIETKKLRETHSLSVVLTNQRQGHDDLHFKS